VKTAKVFASSLLVLLSVAKLADKMCGEDCCRSFAKIILIVVNVIFCLAGLLMLAFGIAMLVAPDKIFALLPASGTDFGTLVNASGGYVLTIIKGIGIFMIILGGVVTIISFLGFVGACCESSCTLIIYTIIMIIIVLAEVALIIFAAVFPTTLTSSTGDTIASILRDNFKSDISVDSNGNIQNSTNAFDQAWAVIQVAFTCCGARNSSDFSQFQWQKLQCGGAANPNCAASSAFIVPITCCALKNGTTRFPKSTNDFKSPQACLTTADPLVTNNQGCSPKIILLLQDLLMRFSPIAIGIAAGIGGLQLILITLAIVIVCYAHRHEKYV
jgi:hypothetical protein